jgi:cytosine/adenosine deaminase-related metal-dependent hydrolase
MERTMLWQLTNGTLLLPDGPRKLSGLLVSGGRIEEVLAPGDDQPDILTLNLHGALVIPGLINSHDTLMATYLPTKGENWPHLNWLSFDIETKRSSLFRERMLLDVETLYRLGSLKNLESGVTAVVDHVPDFVRNPFLSSMSVEILPDFGIAHSVCSYSLGWGQGLEAEHKRAVENDLPFILHIAEGFDPESELSLRVLDRAGCLSEHTVLVHGLSLSNDDLDRIAEAGAHFVWCPSANLFAYTRTGQAEVRSA